jgi:hypothetical protein
VHINGVPCAWRIDCVLACIQFNHVVRAVLLCLNQRHLACGAHRNLATVWMHFLRCPGFSKCVQGNQTATFPIFSMARDVVFILGQITGKQGLCSGAACSIKVNGVCR